MRMKVVQPWYLASSFVVVVVLLLISQRPEGVAGGSSIPCPKFCHDKPWHRVCVVLQCPGNRWSQPDTTWVDCPLVCRSSSKRQHKLCVYTGCAKTLGYRTVWLDEEEAARHQKEEQAKLQQIESELEHDLTAEDEDVLFDFLAPPPKKKKTAVGAYDDFDDDDDDDDEEHADMELVTGYAKPRVICDQSTFADPICAYRSNIYKRHTKKYGRSNEAKAAGMFITTFWFFEESSGAEYPPYDGYKGISFTPERDLLFVRGTDEESFVERTPHNGLTTEVVVTNGGCTARVTFGASSLNCSSCSICSGYRFNASVSVGCSNIDHGVDTVCQPLRETVLYPFDSPLFVKTQDGLNDDAKTNSFRIPFCIDALKQQNCLSMDCVQKWMETCTLEENEATRDDRARLRGSA